MPAWPSTLPDFPLAEHFREMVPDTTVRTAMDQGSGKVRQRTTAGVRGLFVSYILDRTQVQTLEGFFSTDLAGGSLSFDFSHPRTENAVTCRFKKPPEYISLNGDYFRVVMEMEVLP